MPISIPPTNTTAASAFVLNGHLPLDATIDLRGLANPQQVWFKYTLGSADFAVATYATGDDGFRPAFEFRFPDALSPPFQSGGTHTVEAFLEDDVGVPQVGDLYISLDNGFIGPGFVPLFVTTLYIQVNVNEAVPAGSPIINNDVAGFPATILSPTGEPTQLRSFPAGESAANLESGVSLWSDQADNSRLLLYDANLVLLEEITWPRGHLRAPIASNRVDTFYAGTRLIIPSKIQAISSDGVLGTEWTITIPGATISNIYHLAPSVVDGDVIYVYGLFYPTGPNAYGVSRFHKSTGVVDAAFVDADDDDYNFGGFYGNEFLVLPGDSFLLMFRGDTDSKVKLFDAAGILVRDFVLPNADVNRMAYDGLLYTSFWTWAFTMDTFDSRFTRWRVSDGAILEEFTLPTTSSGEGFSSDPTSGSASLFGVPECCPFVTTTIPLLRYGPPPVPPIEPPLPGAPGYHLEARYIRRLRRAPHVNNEHLRVFYRRFELDLERGQALASGQGSEPVVLLRISRDGGQTWGEEERMAAGHLGEYQARVLARRLGHGRDLVFEVVVSDPVAWSLVGAFLDLEPGTS